MTPAHHVPMSRSKRRRSGGLVSASRPGDLPGSVVRSSEWDWTMQGGVGVVIKRVVYLEAMYVQYQTDPKTAFIPLVVGFQF